MNTKDNLIEDFTKESFQNAFKTYFKEIGIKVEHWDKLFYEMNNDLHGKNYAYVKENDAEESIGFIQFTALDVSSWFFNTKVGFVREFWIDNRYRGKGYGTELLSLAEKFFKQNDLLVSVLTTDTADEFYRKRGYTRAKGIMSENGLPVFIKLLA